MKFTSKQLSSFLLVGSLFILLYVLYREQVTHQGNYFAYYKNYYIISIALILFSLFSFMIVKEKKVNLILVGASVAFALYIIEALFMYQHLKLVIDRDKFIKSNNLEFDYRTRKQFYIDFKKDNPDAVVAFYPSNYLHLKDSKIFPLTGFSSKKTVFCNELGYYAIFDSDRYGFKNPDKEWDNNLQEYVLVGDSFTQGACVNTEDDITGNLRKILKKENKAGVLNLAFRANGSLVEYGILREYLPYTKTKRVLWVYSENDLQNLENELQNKLLKQYLDDPNFSQNLANRNDEKDAFLSSLLQELLDKKDPLLSTHMKIYLKRLLKLGNVRSLLIKKEAKVSPEFFQLLKESKVLIEANNSEMYFVYFPSPIRYQKTLIKKAIMKFLMPTVYYHSLEQKEDVLKIVRSLNIPIIDLDEGLFKLLENPLSYVPFGITGHSTEKGYKLVAETISNRINEIEKNQ